MPQCGGGGARARIRLTVGGRRDDVRGGASLRAQGYAQGVYGFMVHKLSKDAFATTFVTAKGGVADEPYSYTITKDAQDATKASVTRCFYTPLHRGCPSSGAWWVGHISACRGSRRDMR